MKKETKDTIIAVGSIALTVGTSTLLGWTAELGIAALANTVFRDGLTKGQLRVFGTVMTVGGVGVALATADTMFPKFTDIMENIMDIFPTDAKEVKSDD